MTGFSIKTATTSNADQAIGTMVLAFGADPSEPHWYLPMIGVDPNRQRKGIGSGS
jgi:ribosomal protein S18 acetylase RimI-like enzyme